MDMDEQTLTTADPATLASGAGGSVSATIEVKPHDLVDAWWIQAAVARGYTEFTYAMCHTSIDEIEPTTLEGLLPEGARIVRRAFLTAARKQEAAVEFEGALAALAFEATYVWLGVAAHDAKRAAYVKDTLMDRFPEADKPDEEADPAVPLFVWTSERAAGDGPRLNKLAVHPWEDIAVNYAPGTSSALKRLFSGFVPGEGGKLLLWHGVPGTGKSHALAALAHAWREWCAIHYIADPESFLGDTDYLLRLLATRARFGRDWKLVILEDTGELLTADAHARVGQALSRLLNVTDGMLGENSNTLFLITTNQPVWSFHDAVSRPGRCASRVEFETLPVELAKAWLLARDAAEIAERLTGPVTLAELFAMAAGGFDPPPPIATGLYL